MSTTKNEGAEPRALAFHTRLALLAGLLAVMLLMVGGYYWLYPMAPLPPDVPDTSMDGSVREALLAARGEILEDLRSGPKWGKLAMIYMAHGFVPEAEVCFAQAQRFDPQDPTWPYLLGRQQLRTDHGSAQQSLREAIERCKLYRPDEFTPSLVLAEKLFEENELAQAETLCLDILAKQPDNGRANFLLGTILSVRNDLSRSVTFLTQASASPYTRRRASDQLVTVLRRQGDLAGAERLTLRCQKLPADEPWPDPFMSELKSHEQGRQSKRRRANQMTMHGLPDQKVSALRELASDPDEVMGPIHIGKALFDAGNYAAAEKSLREAVRVFPEKASAYGFLSMSLFKQGEILTRESKQEEARAKYLDVLQFGRQCEKLNPNMTEVNFIVAVAHKRLGQRADAIALLRKAIQHRPYEVGYYLELADILEAEGQHSEAQHQIDQARAVSGPIDDYPPEIRERFLKTGNNKK